MSGPSTIAIGFVAIFIALSCWWLASNRAMPYGDAGVHISTALEFHDAIAAGDWTRPFSWPRDVYPPFTLMVGALGFFLGGRTPASPVLIENLIYVSLLALSCYLIGRRAYGSTAGCLAVVFALGAPLIAEQFHVFMLDAPLTALVAGTVWLVVESNRFERVPIAAAAGVLAGLGLLSKQTFPLYVGGFVIIVLVRDGGWRNVRGLGVFMAIALLISAPWYLAHTGEFGQIARNAGNELNIPPAARPPLLSTANLSWYFWALANGVLFVPLLAFAIAGVVAACTVVLRGKADGGLTTELLGGFIVAFVAITAMPHKDVRYALPLMVFLAVLGTGWITRLRPTQRAIATGGLVLAVTASTVGATFGVGPAHSGLLPSSWDAPAGQGVMPRNKLTIYSNHNYMVAGPRRVGDFLGLFNELRAAGVRELAVLWAQTPVMAVDYNFIGLRFFMSIAHLNFMGGPSSERGPRRATLIHERAFGTAPPCVRLPDGSGVWIDMGDPAASGAHDFCPRFARRSYGP